MNEKQKGFTLIELLVVVTIIGILAAAAIPKLMAAMDKAKIGRCKSDIAAVRGASQMYNMDKNTWPSSVTQLVPSYLPSTPTGPGTAPLGWTESNGDYTITCEAKGNCWVYYKTTEGTMPTTGTACP